MTEAELRRGHRTMGIILALFLFLQAASGALVATELFLKSPGLFGPLTKVHFWDGPLGHLYRILVGLGAVGMVSSGVAIFLKIRARTRGG